MNVELFINKAKKIYIAQHSNKIDLKLRTEMKEKNVRRKEKNSVDMIMMPMIFHGIFSFITAAIKLNLTICTMLVSELHME